MTTQEQKETTKARWGAAIVVIASVVLLAGFVYHPWIGNPGDPGFLAALAAVGSGLLVLPFLAIRGYLRQAGDERWSVLALPFIVMSSTLYTVLPAMEFAPLAAAEAGNDIQAAQAALLTWFFPLLLTSAALLLPGTLGFAIGIARSGVLSPGLTWLVAVALVVMAAARFAPLGVIQLYVGPAAGLVALWPMAYVMWKQPEARPAGQLAVAQSEGMS